MPATISRHTTTHPARALALAALALLLCAPSGAWIWDQDDNGIDDRIEAVELLGAAAAFEGHDLESGRQIIPFFGDGDLRRYPVYVGFHQQPSVADLEALASTGVSIEVFHVYRYIPYVRMELTFDEIGTVAALPAVDRVEAVELVYPMNPVATRTSGVRESFFERFPTVHEHLGISGQGVVVSILDTGVNDAPEPSIGFPGHEAVRGKFVAGGTFYFGNPALNTPHDESENPRDLDVLLTPHGTHVAGTAIGTGGPSGAFGGVAPDALLVDQKVLSDAGAGFGSADGVEWAIANRERFGIRVLNLSLGTLTASDGTDASSRAIDSAFDHGLLAAVAMGNDGSTSFVPSPAAATHSIAVGAIEDRRTIDRSDDIIAGFSNEGPRMAGGTGGNEGRMKPTVAAPGAGIGSAFGALTTDGRQYRAASGTSMASPVVAGVIALILEANPALTPVQVRDILRHTSEHRDDWGKTPASSNPFPGEDPNWHPSGGWGQVDAYAAVKEALRLAGDPASQTQVVFIRAQPVAGTTDVDVTWRSQRETDLVGYHLSRADDLDGVPGPFARLTSTPIPGIGEALIEGRNNRNSYAYRDQGLVAGQRYWYRVEQVSADPAVGTVLEPAAAVRAGEPRADVELAYVITHNAMANDLIIYLGSGPQVERPNFTITGKGVSEADSVTVVPGEATTGNQRHEFSITLFDTHGVEGLLPPSRKNPWFLVVGEGGFINRSGRVESFEMTTFDSQGERAETFATGDPTPQQTVEGQTTTLWIPDDPDLFLPGDEPAVIAADPASGAQGATLEVAVLGAKFLPGAMVTVSGDGIAVDEVTWVRGSELEARISIAAGAAPGPRNVTVTNLDGGTDTGVAVFTVTGEDDGTGDPPVVTELDDSDPAIEYRQGWHRRSDTSASGGGYHRRMGNGNGPSATARLVFEGHQITYFYGVSDQGGTADVYLDGALAATVSYAGNTPGNAPEFGHSITFDGLGEGSHELLVEHRSGAVYVDGFRIVSGGEGGADAGAAQTGTVTSVTTGTLGGLGNGVLLRTVEVGAADEHLSVVVEGANRLVTVNLLDPVGNLLAVGDQLLGGFDGVGLDVAPTAPGAYTVQVLDSLGGTMEVEISIARTVALE